MQFIHLIFKGIHLLKELPCIRKEDVKWQEFLPGSRKKFEDTYAGCEKYFSAGTIQMKEWDEFAKDLPINDDVEEYVKR